jgi:hypothetical protein
VGPVGSHLIAETIYAAMCSDPNSYFNHCAAKECPPIWIFPDGHTRMYGLSGLFRQALLL